MSNGITWQWRKLLVLFGKHMGRQLSTETSGCSIHRSAYVGLQVLLGLLPGALSLQHVTLAEWLGLLLIDSCAPCSITRVPAHDIDGTWASRHRFCQAIHIDLGTSSTRCWHWVILLLRLSKLEHLLLLLLELSLFLELTL